MKLFKRARRDTAVAADMGGHALPWGAIAALVLVVVIVFWAIAFYWSREPEPFGVVDAARSMAPPDTDPVNVPGYVISATLVEVGNTLLNKPGGYLSNDVLPPSILMDNMPSWEYGALIQIRDLAQSMRNDMSRSQSQSTEDPNLAVAEPQFNFPNNSWLFPASEKEYRKGMAAVRSYMRRLTDDNASDAQFFTRADNLNTWLGLVSKRLGSLSQQLSASVGQYRVNVDLGGDAAARQAKHGADEIYAETPWMAIDNVFYQARGATWALMHFLKAAEVDFEDVLRNKNAVVSLRQIIRELEQSQRPVYSPIILNGGGFGFFANHSLTMSSYIARANAGIIDLRALLDQG